LFATAGYSFLPETLVFTGLSVESGWMTGTLLGQLKIVIWLRTAGAGSTAVSCTGFYDWYITFGKSIF
jgi:hypothetical protein